MAGTKLLPCPFCGGEAETRTSTWNDKNYKWTVQCKTNSCMGEMGCAFYRTEAEAIEAWNTRSDYHGYEQAAIEAWESIKEWNTRSAGTCHLFRRAAYGTVDGVELALYECSECGEPIEPKDGWNYCPNCGAKVVSE